MSARPPASPVRGPHLKLALVLGAAGMLATLLLWPYLLVLMPAKLAALPIPLPAAIAAQTLQAGVFCWLLAWLGLFLGARHGLDAPWLRAWIYRRTPDPATPARWWTAAGVGVSGSLLVGGTVAAMGPALGRSRHRCHRGAWRGVLASFYGGIVEEVKCRLLLVSTYRVAAGASATARIASLGCSLSPSCWQRCCSAPPICRRLGRRHRRPLPHLIAQNRTAQCDRRRATGALFWQYGLEHAMLAHFCADLVLHVALPLAGGMGRADQRS